MTTNEPAPRGRKQFFRLMSKRGARLTKASSSEISDLIADLLHLSASMDQGEDAVESTLLVARMHFDAEHENPEEEAA